jgi:hypothetical protein
VSPVRYELGFYISQRTAFFILQSYRIEDLKSYKIFLMVMRTAAEGNIWAKEGWLDRRVEKAA